MDLTLKLLQFISGGAAGLAEICIMYPLDLVKTRLQMQRADDPNRYKSVLDVVRRTYKAEGFLSFYKGILPPVMAEMPKRACKFFFFERYKETLLTGFGLTQPTPLIYSAAGFLSGFTEAFVINPFEVVKIRQQAETGDFSGRSTTVEVAKQIFRKDGFGLRGLNLGLTSTLGRHGVWNMVYFGFYHSVKDLVPPTANPQYDLARRFLIGFTAGTLASIINIPFDVAKSRIQGPQPEPGKIKYHSCFRSMQLVAKEEGILALYKGLVPKVMRLGPGGGIMLIVYESVFDMLRGKFVGPVS